MTTRSYLFVYLHQEIYFLFRNWMFCRQPVSGQRINELHRIQQISFGLLLRMQPGLRDGRGSFLLNVYSDSRLDQEQTDVHEKNLQFWAGNDYTGEWTSCWSWRFAHRTIFGRPQISRSPFNRRCCHIVGHSLPYVKMSGDKIEIRALDVVPQTKCDIDQMWNSISPMIVAYWHLCRTALRFGRPTQTYCYLSIALWAAKFSLHVEHLWAQYRYILSVVKALENGEITCTDESRFESICTIECNVGYELTSGSSRIECTETGEWSENIGFCQSRWQIFKPSVCGMKDCTIKFLA